MVIHKLQTSNQRVHRKYSRVGGVLWVLLASIILVQQLEGRHNAPATDIQQQGLKREGGKLVINFPGEDPIYQLEEQEADHLDLDDDNDDDQDNDDDGFDSGDYEEDEGSDGNIDNNDVVEQVGTSKAIGGGGGSSPSWLPKIYGMLKNTFKLGEKSSKTNSKMKKKNYLELQSSEDDEEVLDYEDLGDEGNIEVDNATVASSPSVPDSRKVLEILKSETSDYEQVQGRQFFPMPMYMMQGIYLVEPRLNPYIDGVLKNLGSEIKVAGSDPLHFRVMPKGRVGPRHVPKFPARRRRRRRRPNRRQQQINARRRRSGKIFGRGNVGLGRIDGLSKLFRDGSTEMQSQTADGNYTLVRSHFNIGPLDMTMRFKTRRGVRQAAATIEKVRVHTVTRVSNEGSEMMDFYLDRPHPENIQVRGRLFPMAQRIARNIFSRLFGNSSFLVARVREKTAMALMSKPNSNSG